MISALIKFFVLPTVIVLIFGLFSSSCIAKSRLENQSANFGHRSDSPPGTPAAVEDMTKPQKYLAIGHWGGTGLSFDVSANSVGVEFDTARAVIDRRPKLNKNGEFDVIGHYHGEAPGAMYRDPSQTDQPTVSSDSAGQDVRFRGKVTGNKLSLTASFAKTGKTLGTYTLELGKPSLILRPM